MNKLGILAILVILGMTGMVSAAFTCTVKQPATSGSVSGNVLFNITVAGKNNNTVRNCTVTPTSVLTSGSWSVATAYNYSINDAANPYINVTASSKGQPDSNDWIVAATCNNGTETAQACTGTSSVTIDNTVPVCTHVLSSSTSYKPTQTWSITATNATSCTLQFGSNSPLSMNEASDVCTYSGDANTIPQGSYTVTGRTSDGTNTTSCTLTNVRIDAAATVKQVAVILAQQPKKGAEVVTTTAPANKNMLYVGLAVLGLILFSKRKK